ncbi:hypothetical protein GCM10027589_12000 [Actinocorallia lasiicapitis]
MLLWRSKFSAFKVTPAKAGKNAKIVVTGRVVRWYVWRGKVRRSALPAGTEWELRRRCKGKGGGDTLGVFRTTAPGRLRVSGRATCTGAFQAYVRNRDTTVGSDSPWFAVTQVRRRS